MAVHSKFRISCHLDLSILFPFRSVNKDFHNVQEINIMSFFQIIVRKWVKKFRFYSIKNT